MTTRILPTGTENCTGQIAADGDILIISSGSQTLNNLNFSAYSAQKVLLGRACQVRTSVGDPLTVDLNQNDLTTTTPSTLADFRTGAQAFHFTPGGPGGVIRRVNHAGNSPLVAVGSSGRIYRWEGVGGTGLVNPGVRLDELILDGETMRVLYNANAMTDVRGWRGVLNSERGFSGTCELIAGCSAMFARGDPNATLGTGGTLRVMGGNCQWQLGNLTTVWYTGGVLDISQAPKALSIGTLYITSRMKRTPEGKLLSQHAAVTLPATVGTNLFVYGDETDDLSK